MSKTKEIINRKASYEYKFHSKYEAGIILLGSEIKSIRKGHVSLTEAYCFFIGDELFLKNMYIKEYDNATHVSHETHRDRKLLLHRQELKKLQKRVKEKGFSIVPYRVYFSDRNFIKVEIALAQGKKSFDKRETIKAKDTKRDLDRMKKIKI